MTTIFSLSLLFLGTIIIISLVAYLFSLFESLKDKLPSK